MRNPRELRIVRDELIESEYNSSYVLSTFQQAGLSVCSPIEIEEKDIFCVRIDKQVPGCNILMHNSYYQIEEVHVLGKLL